MAHRIARVILALAGVAVVTGGGLAVFAVNATTIGFAYLLLVLSVATLWGFVEASVASLAATLAFNYFFLPPVKQLTIADPQNWVALFSFFATALIASRLSAEAKRRTLEAVARQNDVERLYSFSRAILLIDGSEPFPKQLVRQLADIFEFQAALLYDRRTDAFYRAGPSEIEGLQDRLRESALHGSSFFADNVVVTAVRLGSQPIAALALQKAPMQDSLVQGLANLVAIGLERARAHDLSSQVAAARQSEKLRTTILDALAHEFKTPLTSVMAATTSLLADPDQPREARIAMMRIAGEEAARLKDLVDDAIEMGRLDRANIEVQPEMCDVAVLLSDVVTSLRNEIDERPVSVSIGDDCPKAAPMDRRLVKLAAKQLVNNALKYSPANTAIEIRAHNGDSSLAVDVTDHGPGIPKQEQERVFERLYRSPSVQKKILGSGLGLAIARSIARAHHGDVTVQSVPGETTFTLRLPLDTKERTA